ncbi:MAG: hypothetical protein J6X18_04245 [Bacteroidales bacterium]|nr:hypothetical protein [Bacteroidales bacterium]
MNLLKKECVFLMFSNEDLNDSFDSFNVIYSKEQWYVDQYIMSLCDYIIGPPSSFSGWASYMGDVPLYQIRDTKHLLSLEDFKVFNLQTIL